MAQTIHGIIHGKTIELAEDPGLLPGQAIVVELKQTPSPERVWGDGLRRSAGAFGDTPEDDAILEQIYQERKLKSNQELAEDDA